MTVSEGAPLADNGFVLVLWAWAAEIVHEPYAEGLEIGVMVERWQESRRPKRMPTVAQEVLAAEEELREQQRHQPPAWIPDDTWPLTHEQTRQQQAARAAAHRAHRGWRPPTAA
ncbi:MAG TPA: hypothetical protein VGL02_19800 [Streptomyces sp.]